jgi:hypothetical protein
MVEYTSNSSILLVESGVEVLKAEFLLAAEETRTENIFKLDIGNCDLIIANDQTGETFEMSAAGSGFEKTFTDYSLKYDIDMILNLNTEKGASTIDTSVELSVFKYKGTDRYDTSLDVSLYVGDRLTNDDQQMSLVLDLDQILVPGKPQIEQPLAAEYIELDELDEPELQELLNQVMGNLVAKVFGNMQIIS